jgi:hypothetical protein
MVQVRNENDIRLAILNTLLTCPHRELSAIHGVHAELVKQDPRFYVRLAAWYGDTGAVRDHQEMFAATLILSDFEGHRDVGLALLRRLPPYQVERVVDFIHGRVRRKKAAVAVPVETPAPAAAVPAAPAAENASLLRRLLRGRRARRAPATAQAVGAAPAPAVRTEFRETVERTGLERNLPRSLKTEVRRYLREREAKDAWLDECAVTARRSLKRLYALTHTAPSARAQAILFEEAPPVDSKLFHLKALARAETPAEQARAILEHRIPYRISASVVRLMTPAVLVALVESMTPQELINNLASLKRRGALENADLKALIERKLETAKTDKRVSAYKTKEAVKAAGIDGDLEAKLDEVTEAQVKARGKITRPTALLIDKSGSMHEAIEIGKRVGAMISAVCEGDLYVYVFDTIAIPIEPAGSDLAGWEKAVAGVKAGGGTSVGVAIDRMRQKRQYVEQLVITDEEENTPPYFLPSLQKYRAELNADPNVCFVRTRGARQTLEEQLKQAGILADAFQFNGDYYALPNLIPLLTRPSKLELLMEIMEYPLPKRRAA